MPIKFPEEFGDFQFDVQASLKKATARCYKVASSNVAANINVFFKPKFSNQLEIRYSLFALTK